MPYQIFVQADATFTPLENKVWLANAREIIEFFIIKQIKKPRLVLCAVVKHLGSGRALKKLGKTLDCVSCFPLHFFRALPLPACFTTEQSTVEAFLFVKYGDAVLVLIYMGTNMAAGNQQKHVSLRFDTKA